MSLRREGPRFVVVGTCTLATRGAGDADVLLANGLEMIDEMARAAERQGWSPDIMVLPEHFAIMPESDPFDTAEGLDERTVSAVAERARAHGTYVVVPMNFREGEVVHNSAVLLDRSGEPVGVYHKAFPVVLPDGSVERGITPGREFPVWDLDFGRVGIQICWDIVFDDGWQALAAQEAELVLFPSAAPSVPLLASHAHRNCYYVAGSIMRPPSIIFDPQGRIVAQSTQNRQAAVARFDMDYRVVPSTYLWSRGAELKEKYGGAINWDWHEVEGSCLLTSSDPEMPIGRLLAAEGIMTLPEWIAHNRCRIREERGGPPVMPPGLATG
jgi:predicted amidohydrolase